MICKILSTRFESHTFHIIYSDVNRFRLFKNAILNIQYMNQQFKNCSKLCYKNITSALVTNGSLPIFVWIDMCHFWDYVYVILTLGIVLCGSTKKVLVLRCCASFCFYILNLNQYNFFHFECISVL